MLPVDCPKWIIERFKRQAKEAFPKETIAYLYGQIVGDHTYIEGLWVPDEVLKYCGHCIVNVQPEWDVEAIEYAEEQDAVVVGNIHSHPFTRAEIELIGGIPSMEQSEQDIVGCGLAWQQLSGICRVVEGKNGRLRSKVKLWGPTIPLDLLITSVHSVHSDLSNNE